jgi:dTDP-4-dehydrorhamnose reductase
MWGVLTAPVASEPGFNITFTEILSARCAEPGIRPVCCLTDTVVDGEHAPYREEDLPGPVNFYARTKVEAERVLA